MSMERVGQAQCPQHHGREFWALALELQRESGLTPAAFCRREGISDKAFGRWKRKLSQSRQPAGAPVVFVPVAVTDGRPAHGSQPTTAHESGRDLPAGGSIASGGFRLARQDPPITPSVATSSARVELHIHLANGRCVQAHVPAEAHGLLSILAAVESLR